MRRGILAACLVVGARSLRAQSAGSLATDRQRLAEITADTTQINGADSLRLGSLAAGVQRLRGFDRFGLFAVRPEFRTVYNSAIPHSLNDGPLWAGRGLNVSVSGGLSIARTFRGATLRLVAAPTLTYSENRAFQVIPSTTPARSAYANPFHGPGASLDLPLRFGDRRLLGIDAGRSALTIDWPGVSAGVTAANEWWGPGIRNAILMSNNAPGVPRVFVKTRRPLRSRLGRLDAKLISGTLTQSLYFGENANENRTLSGILFQLRPAFDSTLTIGMARVVYAPVGAEASPLTLTLARSFDALFRWENLAGVGQQRSDQIGSVFARWVFPTSGFEVYGEWARMDLPRSATELFTAAHHSGGWTFGFQWAQPRRAHSYLRIQSELTYLEQSRVFSGRPTPDFYAGMASPQGYTQRGQVIGAAIGPGASSQWFALDWLTRCWQAGGFLGRIRWDNDAMYRQPAPTFWRHDMSMLSGLRGGWRARLTDFTAELTVARRFNYLFQNGIASPGGFRTVDVNNITLAVVATPR